MTCVASCFSRRNSIPAIVPTGSCGFSGAYGSIPKPTADSAARFLNGMAGTANRAAQSKGCKSATSSRKVSWEMIPPRIWLPSVHVATERSMDEGTCFQTAASGGSPAYEPISTPAAIAATPGNNWRIPSNPEFRQLNISKLPNPCMGKRS